MTLRQAYDVLVIAGLVRPVHGDHDTIEEIRKISGSESYYFTTLLDQLAMAALTGMLSRGSSDEERTCREAYRMSDTMLIARDKK